MDEWNNTFDSAPPPEGHLLDVKNGDMELQLIFKNNLWWFPDFSMYVYYTPTHWKLAEAIK